MVRRQRRMERSTTAIVKVTIPKYELFQTRSAKSMGFPSLKHRNRCEESGNMKSGGLGENNQPTWRTAIRQDVDEAIQQSLTWRQFLSAMERKGYEVTWDASIVLRPPGKGALCSLQNAGQAVHTRSHRSASCITKLPPLCWSTNNPTWPSAQRQATPQVDDLQALYYRYLYELGALPHASHTAPAMPCGRMPTS